jgi:hypothetical protein
MTEQRIIDLVCNRLPVEMIVRTDSVLQPELYAKDFDYSFVVVLKTVNQFTLNSLNELKQSIFEQHKLQVSFEVLSSAEIELIPKQKHSFLSGLLTIYIRLSKAKIVYQSNQSLTVFDVDKNNIDFASSLCSQELVEAFRKMFLKAKFNPQKIDLDRVAQKKIRKIIQQELILVQNNISAGQMNSILDKSQKMISTSTKKSNYVWLSSAFNLSEELHSTVINNE